MHVAKRQFQTNINGELWTMSYCTRVVSWFDASRLVTIEKPPAIVYAKTCKTWMAVNDLRTKATIRNYRFALFGLHSTSSRSYNQGRI